MLQANPHADKLALLDFGLVAQFPEADRGAVVSATVHTIWCDLKFYVLQLTEAPCPMPAS